jgi:predicted component of type VI protein secretion system
MALRFDVISDHRQRLGERSGIVLGVAGGSIGRALDNDWVLPDMQRFLSGRHARIHFRQGAYYLEDISTNGVFVNEATTALGRRGPHALRDGDKLRMGEYLIQVSIDATDSVRTPGTGTMQAMSIERVTPMRGSAGSSDDLGASLNIEALIPPRGLSLAAVGSIGPGPETPELSAQQRLTRLRAAARARLEGSFAPLTDGRNGMYAFCRGAGIDPARVPMENEARSLHLAGQLLREAVLGLKEILRAQQQFQDKYQIEAGVNEHERDSPLGLAADDYLLRLFEGHEKRELDAVLKLRGVFGEAGKHVAAVDPAVRGGLAQFMAHLAPGNFEARVADVSSASASGKWERYKDVYANLLQSTGDVLPHLFVEALAQAYLKSREETEVDEPSQTGRRQRPDLA